MGKKVKVKKEKIKKSVKLLAKIVGMTTEEVTAALDSGDYSLLTDSEADARTREHILDSVWAFKASFIAAHARDGVTEEVIQSIQANDKCESNNPVILALIKDVDAFVDDAIRSDGRGQFLSSYDGEEIEIVSRTKSGKNLYMYAYRHN
jgi:hypothetical protein